MPSLKTYMESDLWLSFINGDRESFSILYRQSYKKLYSYGLSLGMEDEKIRDIIQEIFMKLYSKPDLITDPSTLKSFLFVSVRNAFINHEKFRKKHLYIVQLDNFDMQYSVDDSVVEDEEERKIIKAKVESIMKILTPRQKEIIYLRFLHQMEYEEIASIMNLSEQSARNLTARAIDKMRKNNSGTILLIVFSACIPTLCDF